MKEPTLVIMAAGMGSRFGGLKQIEPVSDKGEIILDFSLYDAVMAGFKKAIFIIKKEIEEDFKSLIKDKAEKHIQVEYAFQEIDDLPEGYSVPGGRVKPWGTCHAVLACRDMIDGPFAVINADDYYGPGAFQIIYDYLCDAKDDEKYRYCMVGYKLENTLTENGYVARGVCKEENGYLTEITEREKIRWEGEEIVYTVDDGKTFTSVPRGTTVSMNFWGFNRSFIDEIKMQFASFLDKTIAENPLKGEYYLPLAVDQLLKEDKATVRILISSDRWYGVTYREDKESVVAALQSLKDKGIYPDQLWK